MTGRGSLCRSYAGEVTYPARKENIVDTLEQIRELLLGPQWIKEQATTLAPIHTLQTIVKLYKKEHDWAEDEDPGATSSAILEAQDTLDELLRLLSC